MPASQHQTNTTQHNPTHKEITVPTQFSKQDLKNTFGTSRKILCSYVERPDVDNTFLDALAEREYIVIHGSSKQGKTSLWKKHIEETDAYKLNCGNIRNISDLHTQILKSAGYVTETHTASNRIDSKIEASVPLYIFKFKSKLGASSTTSTTSNELSLNPEDPNDIIRALQNIRFSGNIIVEDFHYLDEQTQKHFTRTLKAFYDEGKLEVTFIIVGVWQEANRLELLNGDLTGRLTTIDADTWNDEQLRKVVRLGEENLKIKLNPELVDKLIHYCEGAVYLLQDACYKACEKYIDTPMTADMLVEGDGERLIKEEIKKQRGRYERFLTNYTEDNQPSEFSIRKWIAAIFISYVRIRHNKSFVSYTELKDGLAQFHPRSKGEKGINSGNLTSALQAIGKRQQKLEVNPPILNYDANRHILYIVDRGFAIWLKHEDVEIIDEAIDISGTSGKIDSLSASIQQKLAL